MTITLSEHPEEGFIEIGVTGRVTEADMNAALPQIERFIETHGTIRIVEVIAGFEGFDLAAVRPGIAFDLGHLRQISHAAVVCDRGWMGPVSRLVGTILPVTVRTFASHDRDAARAWAADPDA